MIIDSTYAFGRDLKRRCSFAAYAQKVSVLQIPIFQAVSTESRVPEIFLKYCTRLTSFFLCSAEHFNFIGLIFALSSSYSFSFSFLKKEGLKRGFRSETSKIGKTALQGTLFHITHDQRVDTLTLGRWTRRAHASPGRATSTPSQTSTSRLQLGGPFFVFCLVVSAPTQAGRKRKLSPPHATCSCRPRHPRSAPPQRPLATTPPLRAMEAPEGSAAPPSHLIESVNTGFARLVNRYASAWSGAAHSIRPPLVPAATYFASPGPSDATTCPLCSHPFPTNLLLRAHMAKAHPNLHASTHALTPAQTRFPNPLKALRKPSDDAAAAKGLKDPPSLDSWMPIPPEVVQAFSPLEATSPASLADGKAPVTNPSLYCSLCSVQCEEDLRGTRYQGTHSHLLALFLLRRRAEWKGHGITALDYRQAQKE
ncbi:unnamed protein product [Chondrus crispus]|uniref:C2H2-type domain-containing protein n=1 Tax=Chondrus crispus TaxID=2769 RepID=R7QJE9_CHOCR|nr:unnamed protein product [Chondrus crispus]CDF37586.1 unnamed protein product [Chondrus crispus]|eukprot:XP_005717457.1 unnamed protein product [Chondrus crispus]